MNVNEELFRKNGHKEEFILSLTDEELLAITPETAKRIVKEGGSSLPRSRDKRLWICHDYRSGNDWNSTVEGFSLIKGRLFIDIYVQYGNTDRSTCEEYSTFFQRGDYRGEIKGSDRYGNERTYYFTYSKSDKARVLRSLLLQFIINKKSRKYEKA